MLTQVQVSSHLASVQGAARLSPHTHTACRGPHTTPLACTWGMSSAWPACLLLMLNARNLKNGRRRKAVFAEEHPRIAGFQHSSPSVLCLLPILSHSFSHISQESTYLTCPNRCVNKRHQSSKPDCASSKHCRLHACPEGTAGKHGWLGPRRPRCLQDSTDSSAATCYSLRAGDDRARFKTQAGVCTFWVSYK